MDEERKRDEHKGINERTEGEQRLAAVLREGLEQEIGEIPEVSINIDELKQLEAADRKTRKIKRLRTISAAAAAVIVCAAIFIPYCRNPSFQSMLTRIRNRKWRKKTAW